MQASTPVNITAFEQELRTHPDKAFVAYLISGLKEGFHTGIHTPPATSFICRNLRSALANPEAVSAAIKSELDKGYLIGPFDQPPFANYRISPIGIVEKKFSGKKRIIVDLSAPHNDSCNPSINELIPKEDFSLSYVKIDDAIKIINDFGPGAWLCKTDIVDAFKLLPIHPSLWHLHGIRWDSKFYFYVRLTFGCRSSPKIFDTLSLAICWIATNNYGVDPLLHLLDDFLSIDKPSSDGDHYMALLTLVFNRLGVPIAPHKTVGPAHSLEYLGIILDSRQMLAILPQNKVDRLCSLIQSFLVKRTCTQREAMSLLGHLCFACKVVVPGRSFISRIIEAIKSVGQLHHHISLTSEFKADLRMWLCFLSGWNGVSLFLDIHPTLASDMHLFTDAASTIGHAGYYQGSWFQERWPENLTQLVDDKLSMAYMELYPIVVAACLWGHCWSRKRVLFHCDNQATVHIINKGRSKALVIMKLVRRLVLLAAKLNFAFSASFIPGVKNEIADSLSRFQMARFWELAPDANPLPCQIPYEPMFN